MKSQEKQCKCTNTGSLINKGGGKKVKAPKLQKENSNHAEKEKKEFVHLQQTAAASSLSQQDIINKGKWKRSVVTLAGLTWSR